MNLCGGKESLTDSISAAASSMIAVQRTDFCYFPDFAFSAMIATAFEPAYSAAGGSMFANATTVYGEPSTRYSRVLTPGNPPP